MRKTSYLTVTDQFCGAGGSSIGAKNAGAEVQLALNHWRVAIETHSANFPDTDHDIADMSGTDPRRYRRTDILITSPECTNHSLAKGVKRRTGQADMFDSGIVDPAAERSRATMWDVPRFAEHHQYEAIIVENVPDARQWVMWDAWIMAMGLLGYAYECVYANSMFFHPTPQSRDRMYVVFWKKTNKRPNLNYHPRAFCQSCARDVLSVQSWKKPTKRFGKYKQQYLYRCPTCANVVEPYYYCAWNVIDWSLPSPRIGDRKVPLKDKTLARIRHGLEKFGKQAQLVHNYSPGYTTPLTRTTGSVTTSDHHALLIPTGYTHETHDRRSYSTTDPMPTQSTRQELGLAVPPFIASYYGNTTMGGMDDPLGTVTTMDRHAVVVPPFLASVNYYKPNTELDSPAPTQTTGNHYGVVTPPWLIGLGANNHDRDLGLERPMTTVTGTPSYGVVTTPPFLVSYYGGRQAVQSFDEAMPTVPGMALHYMADPASVAVEDCGFRMLQPHEIGTAMAFPSDYKITGDKRQQIKQYGNAVTPPVMEWLFARVAETLK